jgi:enoyl-CoA hydratase/carnithine racemase
MSHASPVFSEVHNGLGIIVLNRPRVLNALNQGEHQLQKKPKFDFLSVEMMGIITRILNEWNIDESIKIVLFTGAGDKAFCAGGDIKVLLENPRIVHEFLTAEYTMDYLIHTYPKPVVVLMNGITMGSGVGISWNSAYRIATDKTVFAMPEVISLLDTNWSF